MKYNYCPKCDRAYVKSRLERDKCIYCGSGCETVDVKRGGIYYLGYGIMLAGAGAAVFPRLVNTTGPSFFLAAGVALAIAGAAFVLMGNSRMAGEAKEMALGELDGKDA